MTTKIPLLQVSQWVSSWDDAEWAPPELPKPSKYFFMGSIPITTLRKLSGVNRRQIHERKNQSSNAGYQRAHQSARSKNIARYIQYGYPLSNQASLNPDEHRTLIHPGWLPTAILVNVLGAHDTRRRAGKSLAVSADNLVSIERHESSFFLSIPERFASEQFALPKTELEPIEVIDGQHRLFALDEMGMFMPEDDYEVPVIFFDGLTEAWQAYLFWVINVEPKKINASLAYDLYPELRNQSWLERGETIKIYQEHRAQELTETLWRHQDSPWRDRIELHGQRVDGHVSNAAFIRSLMSSFVRKWGGENRIGGLFGSINTEGNERVLPWKRSQQAAFLITCWSHVHEATKRSNVDWVNRAREDYASSTTDKNKINPHKLDSAFAGGGSLLATDQGVRAISVIFNAVCQVLYSELELETWESERISDSPENEDVSIALAELQSFRKVNAFLKATAQALVDGMDWRVSSSASLSASQKQLQAAYRGSAGYSLLQEHCYAALQSSNNKQVADAAAAVVGILKK